MMKTNSFGSYVYMGCKPNLHNLYGPIGELEGTEGQFYAARSVALKLYDRVGFAHLLQYYVGVNKHVTGDSCLH
jgi:hypothetical protein